MTDPATTFFTLSILTLLAVLMIFGMKYFSAGRIARARAHADGEVLTLLKDLQENSNDMKRRLSSVERTLNEVA